MEEKKTFLIQILEALLPYWDLAKGFLFLVQQETNDLFIDKMYHTIKQEIKQITSKNLKKQINTTLKKLKEKEQQEERNNEDYLEDLLDNIE
ncbi:MAG: hypothetical protein K6E76_04210 [Patescibacteria group bacterium]|nr:hypothetical protein [Patescibacteria group bacterium]